MRILLSILAVVLTSGCTTIHFDNGSVDNLKTTIETEDWHHNVALDLYELSKPVVVSDKCKNKEWVTVTTEETFINGLAASVVNNAGPIWYPKTIRVTCQVD